jgi:hypothetical protein
MQESSEKKVGGDAESVPTRVPGLIAQPSQSEITLKAPDRPGAYRLFTYVFDGNGHAAHANIPFFVDAPPANQTALVPHAGESQE